MTAVKRKLHTVQVAAPEASAQLALPDEVVVSLAEIAGVAKEGLLALAVRTGLSVLHEPMEHEVTKVVGTKGHHDADRAAKRHGHTPGEVTLGGRRLPVSRPWVRTQDGAAEIGLEKLRPLRLARPARREIPHGGSVQSPMTRHVRRRKLWAKRKGGSRESAHLPRAGTEGVGVCPRPDGATWAC